MQSATIITIGDELLIGQVVDTNSAWIGRALSERGVAVRRRIAVADDLLDIEQALQQALNSSQVVIVTGGLGPTKDDITKHALASFFGVPMYRDEAVFEHVRTLMATRGVEFNSLNQSQADVPSGFTALGNAVGTAPGLFRDTGSALLFCLPGVPFEMKELLNDKVLPIIESKFSLQAVLHSTVLVYGLPESELAVAIAEWEDALPDFLKLAYLPNPGGIRLRLSAYGVDRAQVEPLIAQQFEALRTIIPDYYLGYEPTSIEFALGAMLSERGANVAVAESCTGGTIAARLTANSGASAYFKGGVVAYDNTVKTNVLGVSPDLIASHGAVSAEVVEAMAVGVLRAMGSDYSIATSGVAGPTGGSDQKPVGTVWVAVAERDGAVHSYCKNFGEPRSVCIDRSSSFAINALRLLVRSSN